MIDSLPNCRRKQTNFLQGASDLTAIEAPLSKQTEDTTTIHHATHTGTTGAVMSQEAFLIIIELLNNQPTTQLSAEKLNVLSQW